MTSFLHTESMPNELPVTDVALADKRKALSDVSNSSPIKRQKRDMKKNCCVSQTLKAFQAQVKVINLREDNNRLFSFHCLCAMLQSYSSWKNTTFILKALNRGQHLRQSHYESRTKGKQHALGLKRG